MKKRISTRRFAAFIERYGIFLMEYQKVRDRVDILNRTQITDQFLTAKDAAAALARMIREQHADGATVSITMRGLGTSHHLLVLPQAKPDLLRPVVSREMQRLYTDLEDPIVDFVSGELIDRRARSRPEAGTPPQEILAAAVSRPVMNGMLDTLSHDGIQVDHVTVLPRVMQKIYSEVTARDAPSAVLMLLPGGPVFGFFFDHELRLVVEPPSEGSDAPLPSQFVIEQLERGNLYLRQQFRGAQISRLLLAAEAPEFGPLSRAIEDEMGLVVERFGPQIGSSSAIAAMGAVLDAQDGKGLNLFPAGETRKKTAERTTRRIAVMGAILIAAMAWWWAGNGVTALMGWRTRIATLTQAIDRRAAPLQAVREVIKKRQETALQVSALERVAAERRKLQQLLQSLSYAAQTDVTLTSFGATRAVEGWTVNLTGSSSSYLASDAVSSVHRFYRAVPQFVNGSSIALDALDWTEGAAPNPVTTIAFNLHFTAPAVDPNPGEVAK